MTQAMDVYFRYATSPGSTADIEAYRTAMRDIVTRTGITIRQQALVQRAHTLISRSESWSRS